jgi:hypothetical protein
MRLVRIEERNGEGGGGGGRGGGVHWSVPVQWSEQSRAEQSRAEREREIALASALGA